MLRRLAKTGIASALTWTGTDAVVGGLARSGLPAVVGYHRVVEDLAESNGSLPGLVISRRMLEHHLDWIGRRFRLVSLDDLGGVLRRRDPTPAAAVTFDDGYRDLYDHALPLLKRKGIPATVFVVTDLIGTSRLYLHDALYLLLSRWTSQAKARDLAGVLRTLGLEVPAISRWRDGQWDPFAALRALLGTLPNTDLERVRGALEAEVRIDAAISNQLRSLTWEMLVEMRAAGVTIGSHTKTHALLTNEDDHTIREETADSRQALAQRLGARVDHFAYPDGRFDARSVAAVAAAGYRFGYTICRHRDRDYPWLTIPRKFFWETSCLDAWNRFAPAIMSCHLNSVFELWAGCRAGHGTRHV
jgi:peptidoglycan/xylan/chitin deacetylase (PgdA/CDA1 family)